jgi:DNA polymerase-3 subunit epsilon
VDKTRRFIWRNGEAVINFGKHRGRTLREMKSSQPDYLSWIMGSDFSNEVRDIAKDALQGIFPAKK